MPYFYSDMGPRDTAVPVKLVAIRRKADKVEPSAPVRPTPAPARVQTLADMVEAFKAERGLSMVERSSARPMFRRGRRHAEQEARLATVTVVKGYVGK